MSSFPQEWDLNESEFLSNNTTSDDDVFQTHNSSRRYTIIFNRLFGQSVHGNMGVYIVIQEGETLDILLAF